MRLKPFTFLALFLSTLCLANDTKLVLVGGGTTPEAAVEYMAKAGGGGSANVLVITWASNPLLEEDKVEVKSVSQEPPRPSAFERVKARFDNYAVGSVLEAPQRAELLAGNKIEELKNKINKASVIFFSGGDQDFIMEVLKKHPEVEKLIKKKYKEGTVVGGTSAGTAIMSDLMITSEEEKQNPGKFKFVRGLGLLPENWVADQHFDKKPGRTQRMLSVITQDRAHLGNWDKEIYKKYKGKKYFGLGVYEDCAFVVLNGERARALGRNSYAELFKQGSLFPQKITPEMEINLTNGEVTNLDTHSKSSTHK